MNNIEAMICITFSPTMPSDTGYERLRVVYYPSTLEKDKYLN
jgi:hypothetical protein